MKKTILFMLVSCWLSPFAGAQQFDGRYQGHFSGDLEGDFSFTVNSKYYSNLEGTISFRSGENRFLSGMVKTGGSIDAYFYDNKKDVSSGLIRGTFTGSIANGKGEGRYEFYDASREKPNTSKGTWTTQSSMPDQKPAGPPLGCTAITGKDLPFSEEKPVALRFIIRLNESWKKDYRIQQVSLGARNPEHGRFAPDIDMLDGFYVYTTEAGLEIQPAAGATEAVFNFDYAHFGNKEKMILPKSIRAVFHVKLVNTVTGETRTEKLETSASITSLCNILVNQCNPGDCPTLNGKKIPKGNSGNMVTGDQLRIPLEAGLWVKFLDGTIGYFHNKSQTPWTLSMRGGHFGSTDQWEYTENGLSIQAVAQKALEKGLDEVGDKVLESGLELLLKKSSAVSPGLIVQMMEFLGASKAGGNLVAIKLRSKLEISLYANGTYRIRNLEGAPEIWQKNSKPLQLPVGHQVMIDKKGMAGKPVPLTSVPVVAEKAAPPSWNGEWQSSWGKMKIIQNGNTITGTYAHDNGKLNGSITGNTIKGTWSEAPSYLPPSDAGDIELTLSADGRSFTGRWRYGSNGAWQTGWDGKR